MNCCLFGWKSLVFTAVAVSLLNLSCGFQDGGQLLQAAAAGRKEAAHQPAASDEISRDVATLKEKAADQSHAMMDVDYHFSNLWFAAKAENWPLADFYWKETLSHLRWAVRIIPVRKDNAGQEVKLRDILQSIEQSPFMQVGKTIEEKDIKKFETAYRYTLEGCYACHKAADKPYLRPQIPTRPASAIINPDPHPAWPK